VNTRSSSRAPTVPTTVSVLPLELGPLTAVESRKLNVKLGYKKGGEKIQFVHMLNGTLCATERALCCLVENYQTQDVCPARVRPAAQLMIPTGHPDPESVAAVHAGPRVPAVHQGARQGQHERKGGEEVEVPCRCIDYVISYAGPHFTLTTTALETTTTRTRERGLREMQVHRASDGATFGLAKVLAEYERSEPRPGFCSSLTSPPTSIPELIDALESLIEIKRENILLFLEDGRELKAERLEEAWVGEGPSTVRSRFAAGAEGYLRLAHGTLRSMCLIARASGRILCNGPVRLRRNCFSFKRQMVCARREAG
jgi:hypothetical protein